MKSELFTRLKNTYIKKKNPNVFDTRSKTFGCFLALKTAHLLNPSKFYGHSLFSLPKNMFNEIDFVILNAKSTKKGKLVKWINERLYIKVFLFHTSLLRRNLLEPPLGLSHFSYPSLFKQWKTFLAFAKPDINARGVGRIRDSYANPTRSQPLECLYQALQIREKSFLLLIN